MARLLLGAKPAKKGGLLFFRERGKQMGWVYAAVSASMPGIVRIGASQHDPEERVREANASEWNLPDYTVACATEVDDPFAAKRRVYIAFSHRRIDPRRTFFRATVEEARALIASVGIAVAAGDR
jgi:hypothetical protein